MSDFEINFDEIDDLPQLLDAFDGPATGKLTLRRAKPKKDSPARGLTVKFEFTSRSGDPVTILSRLTLIDKDGSATIDAGKLKKWAKPFVEQANLPFTLDSILNLFDNFPCTCVWRTEAWKDSDGETRNSIRLLDIQASTNDSELAF